MPDLAADLRQASLKYTQRSLATCKPKYQRKKALQVLGQFRRFWVWQQARRPITQLAELHLADFQTYQQQRLAVGIAPATINRDLDFVMALLRERADRGLSVHGSVLRLRPLPRPDSLPRHLTETQSQQLETYVHSRLNSPDPLVRLENACFFVLAHTGLRASECVDLLYQDLDLPGRRLFVRQGKGQRDRVVYLSDTLCQALQCYLNHNTCHSTDPLWIRPSGQPITYHWLYQHITILAQAAGVPQVTLHRLRHTLATRLLNVGMDITRIQKLLGHEHVSTTMIYARVQDSTVEADYRRAMGQIELRHAPLSNTPIPAVNWPTQTVVEPANQVFKELTLDNSV